MENTAIFLKKMTMFPNYFLLYICSSQKEITEGIKDGIRPTRNKCQEKQTTLAPLPSKEKKRMQQDYLST